VPITPTYPGVYIEEISSGVRTITGVATSITAFLGFAFKGPTNDPIRVQNFGDFERVFGGLTYDSTMSYAVQQFFLNGGSDALIVRLANPGVKATAQLKAGADTLELEAAEVGREGNKLSLAVNHDNVPDDRHFNLIIKKDGAVVATILNIQFDEVGAKLASELVRVKAGSKIGSRLDVTTQDVLLQNGADPAKEAKIKLPYITKDSTGADVTKYLVLKAKGEGEWGNNLRVSVDHNTAKSGQFNLLIEYVEGGRVTAQEKIRNLDVDKSATRYVVDVLKLQSTFLEVDESSLPAGVPNVTSQPIESVDPDRGTNGDPPSDDRFYVGSLAEKTGLYALEKADLFNLLCISPVNRETDITATVWGTAAQYCSYRRAILIVDPPIDWDTKDKALSNLPLILAPIGDAKKNAAIFFPRVKLADPLKENRLDTFVPCGVLAGIFARTDAQRGVWKAPAGIDASLTGVRGLPVNLTDGENGQLNPLGLNCLRNFTVYGNVVWGSRTMAGDDRLASEWKYLPVRRIALFLEESLYRGTQWVVFEPNDEPLWAQIRLNLGAFMNNLFRQGAFQGKTPKEAYFVKCDKETTTQNDINLGIVNIVVGFAPLKPAEFVIIKFQQITGQIDT
jgi:uncharacterized protein